MVIGKLRHRYFLLHAHVLKEPLEADVIINMYPEDNDSTSHEIKWEHGLCFESKTKYLYSEVLTIK